MSAEGVNMTDDDFGKYPECIKGPLKKELCKGLDALELRPTAHQVSMLTRYLELLEKWNKVYNLTAVRDINEMLVQHMFDCLAVIKPLQARLPHPQYTASGTHILDVGSGAGLPAVVIATLNPEWQVTAIDAVNKKIAFVQQQSVALGLTNLTALHERIENIKDKKFDLIISRAFSSLVDFVALSENALSEQGIWCAMKGKEPLEEMVELKNKLGNKVEVFHVEHIKVPNMEAQRCLIWIKPKS